jgi:hypothetical protein
MSGRAEQAAAADRASITAFREITSILPARLLSYGVELNRWRWTFSRRKPLPFRAVCDVSLSPHGVRWYGS